MMGPTCSIVLERKIDFEEIHIVDEFLESIVKGKIETTKSTRNFWIDAKKLFNTTKIGSNCQFSIYFDNELREIEEDMMVQIEILTKRSINSLIGISSGCNRSGDHTILGELTFRIAKLLNGLIDFGGDLNIYQKGITKELDGNIYSIVYNEGMAAYQISDIEFLNNWMNHPNFRMIK